MSELLPFIIAGLVSGSVYSLSGIGLVLTYKTSGVFNFAYGAMATVSAYTFYELYVVHGVSWPISAAIAVLVVGPIMGVIFEPFARRIATRGLAIQVAGTVGILLAVESIAILIYGTQVTRTVPVFITTASFTVWGASVQWFGVTTFAFTIAVTILLAAFLRRSRRGVEMRATVDNPELLTLFGTGLVGTRRTAWIIGSVLASASGVLFAPLLPLDPVQLTLLIVAAFGAAAIGAFDSLPLTLAGGLIIGVLASLSTKFFTSGLLAGLSPSVPFIAVFVVLLVARKRWLAREVFTAARVHSSWSAPLGAQLSAGVGALVLLGFVPAFAGIHITAWTSALATAIVFLSLSILVRMSGQVSLAQVSFTAIGAAAFAHFAGGAGIPWLLALLLSGLVAVPVGAILAVPAIRHGGGLYLALATFGFGILFEQMFFTQSYMFGASGSALTEPRPGVSWLASDNHFYYVVLFLLVIISVVVATLNRTRLGRLMRGMADSPMAVVTSGADVGVTRILVFCIAAFLAAVGGALIGVSQTTTSGGDYQPFTSLLYFVAIMVIAGGTPWNAILAALGLTVIPAYIQSYQASTVLQLIFGAGAVAFAMTPESMLGGPASIRRMIDRVFARRRQPDVSASAVARPRVEAGALEVTDLTVRFGGVVAVDNFSFSAPTGRITGLIGPNGAGKTTTFNACSGLVRPSAGHITLHGQQITRRGPAARARLGLGRTFQRMELLESLTVRENVAMGAEGARAGNNPITQFGGGNRNHDRVETDVADALKLCSIQDLAGRPVSGLSTGQRRLVELARCLAGDFSILLLDEPSSGLDKNETKQLGQIIASVVADRGVGILLVEHDMSLVLEICHHIYVLDFGELIFEGSPQKVAASPIVRDAYLGTSDVELEAAAASAEEAARSTQEARS